MPQPENSFEKTPGSRTEVAPETGLAPDVLSCQQIGGLAVESREIDGSDKEINQKIIGWAHAAYGEFLDLPKKHPVKAKKTERRDRNFIKRTLADFPFGEESHLTESPEAFARAFEVWSVVAGEDGGESRGFSDLVESELYEYGRKKWRNITQETLAGNAQQLSHSKLGTGGIESFLKGYFDGPRDLVGQVESQIRMCLAVKHVLDDQQAIDKIAQIVCFDTPIMPFEGDLHRTVEGDSTGYAYYVDEARLSWDLIAVREGVARISSHGKKLAHEVYKTSKDKLNATRAQPLLDRVDGDTQALSDILHQRRDMIWEFYPQGPVKSKEALDKAYKVLESSTMSPADKATYKELVVDWLKDVLLEPSQYRTEYNLSFGNRWFIGSLDNEQIQALGKIDHMISIPVEEGHQLDIQIPEKDIILSEDELEDLLNQYYEKIKKMRAENDADILHLEASSTDPAYQDRYEFNIDLKLRGQRLKVGVRNQCLLDKLTEHDLNKLMMVDIPDIEDDGFSSAREIMERIEAADEERYVPKRGFKVEFISEGMADIGFQSIVIKQDPSKLSGHVVHLQYKGDAITYKLDQYGNLDMEGRQVYSTRLTDIIHRRTLAVLEYYKTREVIESESGTLGSGESGTTGRPAMLVFLPEGNKFSEEASAYYLEERGGDLKVRSEERKKNNPRSGGRNSTYRRATEVDGENLRPIEISVDKLSIV